ncbi:hypothetical protein J1605_010717 [Eschrichtius robustus]|uniref:Uncharacterized protein n=1 Tax=Eschrichtius robustus TaxID=9764 RepID=A0AB34GR54_ESCRO|nr:hypothetical protein J1605_010717 [Eschrichtius robustus]
MFPSFLCSSAQEPSQPPAASAAAAGSTPEGPGSPGSARPGVAGLTTAAAFKPLGSTGGIKSPSWQRPNQAAIGLVRALVFTNSS